MLELLKKTVFWTYPRGSWQYDILCALILCFIFLTPRSVFDGSAFLQEEREPMPAQEAPAAEEAKVQPAEDFAEVEPDTEPLRISSRVP